MSASIPDYFQSLIDSQPGFVVRADPSRRLPAVLEHLIKPERQKAITQEISKLSPKELEGRIKLLDVCFEGIYHLDDHLLSIFQRYYGDESPLSGCNRDVKIVAAGAISQSFPYEGIASFNPSLAVHPDQSGLEEGAVRVIIGVRSYGEYHRSSLSFRTGIVDTHGTLAMDQPAQTTKGITKTCLPRVEEGTRFLFEDQSNLNNAVLYGPFLVDIGETWEDFRIVRFADEDEYCDAYLGTFTSYNFIKRRLQPSLLVTRDFKSFDYHVLRGSAAEDKDMAFFPKKIKGRYAMLSRNDGRDLFYMTSDDLMTWKKKKKLMECRPALFDAHKMGVCAPPMETASGWLVIYHGVSDPGQIYALSAMLLDLEEPDRVIARLPYTIHHPFADERFGMLSTINYTCGAMIHEASDSLVMPYAVNDTSWKVGRINMGELMARLMDDGAV